MRRLLPAVLCAALFSACQKPEPPPAPEPEGLAPARIAMITGPVSFRATPEQDYWAAAKPGQELAEGSSVWVRDGGRALIRFPDGTSVLLEPNSTVVLREHGPTASELRLEFGFLKAWAQQGSGREFRAGTSNAVAAVRGTRFTVLADGARTIFELFEGLIEIADRRGTRRTLQAGKRLVARAERPVDETPSAPIPKKAKMAQSPPEELLPPPEPAPPPKKKKVRKRRPVKKKSVKELRRKPGYMPGLKERGMPGIQETEEQKKWRRDKRREQSIPEEPRQP